MTRLLTWLFRPRDPRRRALDALGPLPLHYKPRPADLAASRREFLLIRGE